MKKFQEDKLTIILDMILELYKKDRLNLNDLCNKYSISERTKHRYIACLRNNIYNLSLSSFIDIQYENGIYILVHYQQIK